MQLPFSGALWSERSAQEKMTRQIQTKETMPEYESAGLTPKKSFGIEKKQCTFDNSFWLVIFEMKRSQMCEYASFYCDICLQ